MYKLLVLVFVTLSFSTSASWVAATGAVAKVRSFSLDSTADNGAVAGATWIRLEGVTSLGSCPQVGSAGLLLYITQNNSKLVNLALAAQMAGKNIEVGLNDSKRFHNGCVVDYISVI